MTPLGLHAGTIKRLVRRAFLRWILAAVVLAGLVWFVAARGVGMATLVPWALDRTLPEGWTVHAASVEGDWRSTIRVHDLEMHGPGTSVSLPEGVVEYRLSGLLRKEIDVHRVMLDGPDVDIAATSPGGTTPSERADAPDSDPLALLSGSPLGDWEARVRSLEIEGARITVASAGGTYRVDGGDLTASGALGPDGLGWTIDTLGARIRPPAAEDEGPDAKPLHGHLSLASELHGGRLVLDHLSFDSRRSSVHGSGELSLTADAAPLDSGHLTLTADPLDLRDLPIELPQALAEDSRLDIEASARSVADSIVVEARLRGPLQIGIEAHGVGRRVVPGSPPGFTLTGSLEQSPGTGELQTPMSPKLWADFTVSREEPAGPVDWTIDLGTDSASASGAGSVDLSGEAPSLELERLTLERFDARELWETWPHTAVTGTASGTVVGTDPDDLRGDIRVGLASSEVNGTVLDTLALVAALSPGRADGEVAFEARGLRAETPFAARLADSTVSVDFPAVRLDGSLPARQASDSVTGAESTTRRAVAMTGSAAVEWRQGMETPHAAIDLAVDSASSGEIVVRSARARTTLEGARVAGDADMRVARVPPTAMAVTATWDVTDPYSLSDLLGTVQLTARPAGPEQVRDSVSLTVVAREPGHFDVSGTFGGASAGHGVLEGSVASEAEALSFDATVRGELDEPSALLPDVVVDSLSMEASGTLGPNGLEDAVGHLAMAGASWRELSVDTAYASTRVDSLGARLDTLVIRANAFSLAGQGRLPPGGSSPGRIELTGELLDSEPLRALAGLDELSVGATELSAVATGTMDSISLSSSASARALVYDRLRLSGLDVDASATVLAPLDSGRLLPDASLEVALDRLVLPDAEVGSLDAQLTGTADSLRLDVSAVVDRGRRGSLLVQIDPRPDRRTARLERLDLQLDQDEWSLREPARLAYANGYSVEELVLEAGGQVISVDGAVDSLGALDVAVDMDSTDIGTVADLATFPGLQGWVGGTARIRGTTAEPRGHVVLEGAFHRSGTTPAPVEIELESEGARVNGHMSLRNPEGGELVVDGSYPFEDGATRPPAVDVRAEAFDLGWALPFLDPDVVSELSGTLDADLSTSLAPSGPELSGDVSVRGGRARLPALGVTYEDLTVTAHGEGGELVVESAEMESGSGDASATGRVTLAEDFPLEMRVLADRFDAVRTEAYRAAVSGDLDVRGTAAAPTVEGTVRVESLDVYLGRREVGLGLEDVELTERDLEMLRDRFGYVPERDTASAPVSERLTADLVVELGRDSWLRKESSPEMAVAFSGDLQVDMRPGEEVTIEGSVETIAGRGYVEQFGRRFDLREGSVTFDGPPSSADLDLSATYTIPSHDNPDDAEATIVLDIEGTRESLSLTLSSEPPMENADIVSYIATGRPASGTLSTGGGDAEGGGLAAAGTDLALEQLTGLVEDAAAAGVGLDVVEIRREGIREATLVAGKYLSPRLYVGFAQPVMLREGDGLSLGDEGESEIEVEIEALRWLLLNIEGSGSSVSFFLRGRHAF